ncbi:Mg-chelatase subunit D/I family [Pseudomonas coronafaciens pv. oryzae]|nr:Mg-chelatase subunit D/I family [Pseudomonas coronafaciens pv. oryzae]
MVTSGQMPLVALQDVECLGERTLIITAVNTEKACLVSGVGIAVNHLLELVVHFNENAVIAPSHSSGLLH